MALQRAPLSLPATAHQIYKLAASSISRSASSQNPQNFHSSTHFRPTSRRKLVTTTSYRPHSFDSVTPPFPAPPRNAGIPDSSIAGTKPQVHDTRPPPAPVPESAPLEPSHPDDEASLSLPESEAQKSKPVAPGPEPTSPSPQPVISAEPPSPSPKPARKSRLRPLKAALTVTPSAVSQLRTLYSSPTPQLIRVGVRNRGCSGLAYHLEYVDTPGAFDEKVEQDGVQVLIDSKALFSIIGSEMDFVEDKLSRRFVFRNPNIKEQCGCGESFMV